MNPAPCVAVGGDLRARLCERMHETTVAQFNGETWRVWRRTRSNRRRGYAWHPMTKADSATYVARYTAAAWAEKVARTSWVTPIQTASAE